MLFQIKIQLLKPKRKKKIKVKDLENEIHIDANELIKDEKILIELISIITIGIV